MPLARRNSVEIICRLQNITKVTAVVLNHYCFGLTYQGVFVNMLEVVTYVLSTSSTRTDLQSTIFAILRYGFQRLRNLENSEHGFWRTWKRDNRFHRCHRVKLGVDVRTGEYVAVKIMYKDNMTARAMQQLRREITSMKALDHPNILRLKDVHEVTFCAKRNFIDNFTAFSLDESSRRLLVLSSAYSGNSWRMWTCT